MTQDLQQLNQLFDAARETVKQTKRVSGGLSNLLLDIAQLVQPKD
jgi:hypothetical protein